MLAILLGVMVVANVLPSAGRIIVVDAYTMPPTRQVVWGFWECFPSITVAIVSLGCILVSMWRRWDFEIVGWALLVILILVLGMR